MNSEPLVIAHYCGKENDDILNISVFGYGVHLVSHFSENNVP